MRRYSPAYFLSTSIKSLWRNGFMTVASIAVLASCLMVMGCFALLVFNIDHNLENIDGLNQIVAFVDVDRVLKAEEKPEEGTDTEASSESETEDPAGDITVFDKESADDGVIDPEVETKEEQLPEIEGGEEYVDSIFVNFEAQLDSFAAFADIAAAESNVAAVQGAYDTLKAKLDALQFSNADIMLRFEEVTEKFEYTKERIALLSNIQTQVMNVSGIDPELVEFKSKSTALAEQKEKYSDYVNLYEVLEEDDNPFPDSFTISYTDADGIDLIQWDLEHIDGVYSVICRAELAENISSLKNGVIMVFSWFLVILFVVSIFVIVNTIKIAVHSRRDEIGVMRFVGATNFFITTPFVIEGSLIGLISGGIGYGVVRAVYKKLAEEFIDAYGMISVIPHSEIDTFLLVGFFGVGIVTGILASAISVRKYLKA